jgi:hypothetical protein
MRFATLAAVALPPAITLITLVACGKSPAGPSKGPAALDLANCPPPSYVCRTAPYDGKVGGATPQPNGIGGTGGSGAGAGTPTPTGTNTPTPTP